MSYRVTATVGRATLDLSQLHQEAVAIYERLRGQADVGVDGVKGAIQVIMTFDVPDALQGVMALTATLITVFDDLFLPSPATIAHVESEHVPDGVDVASPNEGRLSSST
jgi:hypothetical protein